MGSWAKGPFDNDTALDDLLVLARDAGLTWDDEQGLYAGKPDASVVDERLTDWLTATLRDDSHEMHATRAYAALGLLAMALAEPARLAQSIAGEDEPFACGESYASLLDRPRAEALLRLASPALDAVFDPAGDWYRLWFDTDGLAEWRAALTELLLAPTDEG